MTDTRYVIVLDEDGPAPFLVSELFTTEAAVVAYVATYLNNGRHYRVVAIPATPTRTR